MPDSHAARPFQIDRPHFGYGSNMWPPWLWIDAKSARARPEPARLPDHRLIFTKLSTIDHSAKANIAPRRGSEVWGVLFDIDSRELRRLNVKEGSYHPTEITVFLAGGTPIQAWTYLWAGKKTKKWPFRWYVDLINKGAAHFGLPKPYRKALARRPGRRNPDDKRAREVAAALAADPHAPPRWPPA